MQATIGYVIYNHSYNHSNLCMVCRCSGLAEGGRAAPIIEPLSKHPLQFCRDDWHMAWQTQVQRDTTASHIPQSGNAHAC